MAFDSNNYCGFTSSVAKSVAGKDILLCIFNTTGDELLAISGQQSLTINRSADTIEVTSKDTQGGWKSYLAGMKEWSIDSDGIYVPNDQSHAILSEAFENGDPVCVKVVNGKTMTGMFGGLAVITDYPIEAPYDDSMTYTVTLSGMGALVDLLVNPVTPDTMPEGSAALGTLTVVSVAGTDSGDTAVYVNPALTGGNSYKYVTGDAPLDWPTYGMAAPGTAWNGTDDIAATTGNEIMIIEVDSTGKALKAGTATVTAKA